MDLLVVEGLSKTYGSGNAAVKALQNVNFTVPKGEFVAVIGESGSGKTTLLNLIGGLDEPTAGKVMIDGKDIYAMDEKHLTVFRRRNIGFVFQSFNLIPELTVEQNMVFPLLFRVSKAGYVLFGRAARCIEFERTPASLAWPTFWWATAESGTGTSFNNKTISYIGGRTNRKP